MAYARGREGENRMTRYKCHSCEAEHDTDNMIAHCASCHGELRASLSRFYEQAGPGDEEMNAALEWADLAAKSPELYNDCLGRAMVGFARALRSAWKALADGKALMHGMQQTHDGQVHSLNNQIARLVSERDEAVEKLDADREFLHARAHDYCVRMENAEKERDELRAKLEVKP